MRETLTERRAARARRAEDRRWHLEQLREPVVAGIADRDLGFWSWVIVAMVAAFAGLTTAIVTGGVGG